MTTLNVLADMFDPEIILGLELPELFINSIVSCLHDPLHLYRNHYDYMKW